MKPHLLLGAALAAAVLVGNAASAATFSLAYGTAYNLPGNYDPVPTSLPDIGVGTTVQRNATLSLDGPAKVNFSFVGYEASFQNTFQVAGTTYFDNKAASNPDFSLDLGAGKVALSFASVLPGLKFKNGETHGYYASIAFYQASSTVVYALFNDISLSDKDYDDAVVRMEVAPVPLPAAALLMVGALGGLGGVGAMGRRKALRTA